MLSVPLPSLPLNRPKNRQRKKDLILHGGRGGPRAKTEGAVL